jgi:hypothetical protein
MLVPASLRSVRSRLLGKQLRKQRLIEQSLFERLDGKVLGGPFEGLRYSKEACGSMQGPKILGVYEHELASVIEEIVTANYGHIVDVGAAEGYYAVGLLTRCPEAKVTAFETCESGRELMGRIAAANGVADRLEVLGHCTSGLLEQALRGKHTPLIICDIEGGEASLLDPRRIPKLESADILVEIHDFVDTTISRQLLERFDKTHEVRRIQSRKRRLQDLPVVAGITGKQILSAADERRPCDMEWFWMRAKQQ